MKEPKAGNEGWKENVAFSRKKEDLEKDDIDNNNNNKEAKDTWYTHEK